MNQMLRCQLPVHGPRAPHCRALTSAIAQPTHLNQEEFKTGKLCFPARYFAFAPFSLFFCSSQPEVSTERVPVAAAAAAASTRSLHESSSVGGLFVCDGVATLTSYWD